MIQVEYEVEHIPDEDLLYYRVHKTVYVTDEDLKCNKLPLKVFRYQQGSLSV